MVLGINKLLLLLLLLPCLLLLLLLLLHLQRVKSLPTTAG
jgi:hypothetical protein